MPIGMTSTQCTTIISQMLTVEKVVCTVEDAELTGSQIIDIDFQEFPMVPYENNLYTHEGNPPLEVKPYP